MEAALRITRNSTLSQKLFGVCALYCLVAFIAFPNTFIDASDAYPVLRFLVYVPVILLVGLLIAAFIHAPRTPIRFIKAKLKDRGKGTAIIVATLTVSASAFTTLKHEYSLLVPFFADNALAQLDSLIHQGDPWRSWHMILPVSLDYPLFILYSVMWFVEVVCVIVVAAMLADRFARERYFATMVLSVILLSSPIRILASSAGPIFYDRIHADPRYIDLMATLKANPSGPDLMQITDYLYSSYTTQTLELGTGISAMPSLHVAFAFLNAMFIWSLNRTIGVLAWAYFVCIQFGSVYFGWHYAIDGYVSVLFVAAIWTLSTKLAAKSQVAD